MKKMIFVLLVGILLVGLVSACGKSNEVNGEGEKKVLVMGTSADFPPFETRDDKGNIVGFDIDLATYIANELGYELEIKDSSFDGLIGALQAKRFDFVASGMSATEKRQQSVDFSIPYNHSGEMIVTLKDSGITSMEELEGKKLAVQLGTIQEEGAKKLSEQLSNLVVKPLNKVPDMIQELKSGRVDAVYLDKTVAEGYIKELGLDGFDDTNNSAPGMAIAFPKGSDLVESFNKVLQKMMENGELEKLEQKWLQEDK
ncbi:transporter substrate-binding domain-containing protein [Bacillus timonensis]|nr:transporter substrate-binding domain-containing protein [Bacillus timonensis]